MIYPSVRHRGGTCLACFRPALVVNVRRGWVVTLEFSDAFAAPTVRIDKGRKKAIDHAATKRCKMGNQSSVVGRWPSASVTVSKRRSVISPSTANRPTTKGQRLTDRRLTTDDRLTPMPRSQPEVSELFPGVQQEVAHLCSLPEIRSAFTWFRAQEPQFAQWQLELARIRCASVWRKRPGQVAGRQVLRARTGIGLHRRGRQCFRHACRIRTRTRVAQRPPGHGFSRGHAAEHPAAGQPAVRPGSFGQRGRRDRDAGHRGGVARVGHPACFASAVYRQRRGRRRRRLARHAPHFFPAALEGPDPLQPGARWRGRGHHRGRGPGQPPFRGDRARPRRTLLERLWRAQSHRGAGARGAGVCARRRCRHRPRPPSTSE